MITFDRIKLVLNLVYLILIVVVIYDHKQECARYQTTINEQKEIIKNYEPMEREMISKNITIDTLRTKVSELEQLLTKQENISNIDILTNELTDQESEDVSEIAY